ncbi:alpha/beta hydrolase family esterase [Roseovarius dicentrarchi]|uniref:extracellular catalytic domain type 1 short-chain-length polyhydroxyalkanoate depolymerase n=1 Tax=Roseovarius dicentrarchi TaxID=2250573 RepID=UPI000DE8E20A|nr:PHB depolymerase family esterase [Roseovarius dicentrarchi]
MRKFNVGALRPATGDARAVRFAAANDLVQRTLAQHGITSPIQTGTNGLPDATGLLAGLTLSMGGSAAPAVQIPVGAAFRSGTHTGITGSRSYRMYVPSSVTDRANGSVMMLHGCTQTPEDFAIGTGMNALAEARGLIVIYPHQARGDNAQSCWNWFNPGDQRRGRGEPEILAGMARSAMDEFGVPADRSFVAGMSAGAAMAVILGAVYGDVFAAVGAHSGLPLGAARDLPSALAAMASGNAAVAHGAMPARSIVFHGTNDTIVNPANGAQIAAQVVADGPWLDTEITGARAGRSYSRRIAGPAGAPARLEHWAIDGLGHAWSGGQAGGSHTDPVGPDASAEMIRFFLNEKDL